MPREERGFIIHSTNTIHMPIAINTSRPPSASTVPSGAGGAGGTGPRSTTTSRRGGRTRSRSPPVMGGRMSNDSMSGGPLPPHSGMMTVGGGPGGENPSSAAAAAAAAAKAFSSSGGGRQPMSWPGDTGDRSRGGPPDDYYHERPPYGSNWPGEETGGSRYGSSSSRYPSSTGLGGGYGDGYYGRGGPRSSAYGDRPPSRGGAHHPYDMVDRGHHSNNSRSSQPPPPPPHPSHRGHYPPQDSYGRYSSHGGPPPPHHGTPPPRGGDSRAMSSYGAAGHPIAKSQRGGASAGASGTTSLVIGGTTPIHVPKTPSSDHHHPHHRQPSSPSVSGSTSQRQQQRVGSAASVFRGRPGDSMLGSGSSDRNRSSASSSAAAAAAAAAAASPREEGDDDSPQQILLSLRTPTTSFEDKSSSDRGSGRGGPKKSGSGSGSPLSPNDPPQTQKRSSSDQLFEPQRSPSSGAPGGAKPVASFETAPSFSLFNQSFDSFGDGHYFNVDSTLQNDSFGMGRAGSVDPGVDGTTQILREAASGGNFSQQLLASGSGALTLGYSPVNSFGNASASGGPPSRRSSSMMVVGGGPDPLTNSPTQVLGMYRSYSGGGGVGRSGPLDDSHLRMSVGSFGSPSMAYSRSYGGDAGPSPGGYYYPGSGSRSQDHPVMEKSPPFYAFLRRHKGAFRDCTFLLPGLKAALLADPPDREIDEKIHVGRNPSSQDNVVARRRVESSVFAFGGNPTNESRAMLEQERSTTVDRNSIFREKDPIKQESATVTPTTPPGTRVQSRARTKYEEELPTRYYENESRLSWEFEESPPIEISHDDDTESEKGDGNGISSKSSNYGDSKGDDRMKSEGDGNSTKPPGDGGSVTDASGNHGTSSSPQPKMRYRCKLCGQPKQNHTCPYQQSLARSIGIMVFPAVNAFTAAEPGTIAPALSDMNNFIDSKETGSIAESSSPQRPTPDRMRRIPTGNTVTSTTQVTPESMRSSGRQLHSPSPYGGSSDVTQNRRNGMASSGRASGRKRSYAHLGGADDQSDLLFMESMELKPEQFRLVSPLKIFKSSTSFQYPALPLPYAQRKRLSDNLFSLSNEVPKLTDECAQVLREAREKDMWDLAVAELMTQVVVIIHCPDGDNRFEGLRQYLLTLGIAC